MLRAAVALEAIVVLIGARDAHLGGELLGAGAHREAGAGIGEAIELDGVEDLAVAVAEAGARLGEVKGGVGHALHPAGDDNVGGAAHDGGSAMHDGLHAGCANLAHAARDSVLGKAGERGGLASGRLANAASEDMAKDELINKRGVNAGTIKGGTDRDSGKLRGRK